MNYIRIDRDNLVNGPGLRTVLWVAGCENYCKGCHNPETWSFTAGQPFTKQQVAEILDSLKPEHISGITISGGDPLNHHNIVDVFDLCKIIKMSFPEKTIWCYTGNTFEEYLRSGEGTVYRDILNYIDVIIDGKYVEDLRDMSLQWRGSSNQRVINVRESLAKHSIVLQIS